MTRLRSIVLATSMAVAAFASAQSCAADSASVNADQPLFNPSPLPYQAPQFDKIKDSDYAPALAAAMKLQLAEIEAIANNPAVPTFENTLVAMEKSGAMLARVQQTFNAVTGANTNDLLDKVKEEAAPKLAAHQDAITLNDKLFHRIEAVYKQGAKLKLDPESKRLLEVTYRNFVRGGAKLAAADKTKLKALNEEESTLSTQYTTKLLAATKDGALVIDDKAKLAGLTDADIAGAAKAAKERGLEGKYVLTLKNTTQQPALSLLQDRATREALFKASWNRAEKGDANDTRKLILRLAQVRAEQAKLLGFANYAAWHLDDQMAKVPATAIKFMQQLVGPATARAARELKDLQAQADKSQAAAKLPSFKVQPWDWAFYTEQVRKERFDLDESQIKPYFELSSVLENGVFYAANELYGLTFKERHDIPVYQADVRVYEVFDRDGKSMALYYGDYYKRDNKNGGAWMDNMVSQSKLLGNKPVIYNVTNFAKPEAGQPALLNFDDVTTLFHEFGHSLHGLFADEQYPSLSGANTARDFVEFPSQFNEYWATEPKILAHYAKNKAGEAIPQALIDKMKKAATFNKGFVVSEQSAAALLDLNWHSLAAGTAPQDVNAFEEQALKNDKFTLSEVPPRYRSSYFQHIWGGGYGAGYYAYSWTQMLADDSFEWFKQHGGMTRANGDRFRALILSRGNSQDLASLYKAWRGANPSVEPMLIHRGLKEAPAKK
ncbi:MAG: peptidyl-dipeptidase Dcp [Pseudomonadota bacterium]